MVGSGARREGLLGRDRFRFDGVEVDDSQSPILEVQPTSPSIRPRNNIDPT